MGDALLKGVDFDVASIYFENSAIFEGVVALFVIDNKIFKQNDGQLFEPIAVNKFFCSQPGEECQHSGSVITCCIVYIAAVCY